MITLDRGPVTSDPKVCGGTLVFRGTRVFAQTLADYINGGHTLEEFLDDFPTVNEEDARSLLNMLYEGHPGREHAKETAALSARP